MRQIVQTHSYEELRTVVIDVLLGEKTSFEMGRFSNLVDGVAEVLVRRGAACQDRPHYSGGLRMDARDVELTRDIFWDLFRQGIVILGRDENNDNWPFFRLSHHAKETLSKQSPYRFHDVNSYLKLVRNEAPDILQETEAYLEEAIDTFYVDCLLACCVMIGVAAEIEFLRMIATGVAHPVHGVLFQTIEAERFLRQKITKFQNSFPSLPKALRDGAGEDTAMHTNAIQSVLRVARNEAGHALAVRPSSREQVYVNLQMFVPFVGHITRLRHALV